MSTKDLDFWQFSLQFYSRAEIPSVCITLQDDYGIDINLLFFILFLAKNQRLLTTEDIRRIDSSICSWRQKVVQPLRAIRRELKSGVTPVDKESAEVLRSAIKRDELQAERLQQEALERGFPLENTGSAAEPLTAAKANIDAYASILGTSLPQNAVNSLLNALAAEFPNIQKA